MFNRRLYYTAIIDVANPFVNETPATTISTPVYRPMAQKLFWRYVIRMTSLYYTNISSSEQRCFGPFLPPPHWIQRKRNTLGKDLEDEGKGKGGGNDGPW